MLMEESQYVPHILRQSFQVDFDCLAVWLLVAVHLMPSLLLEGNDIVWGWSGDRPTYQATERM